MHTEEHGILWCAYFLCEKTSYCAVGVEVLGAELIDIIVTSGFNSEEDVFASTVRSRRSPRAIDVDELAPVSLLPYEGRLPKS